MAGRARGKTWRGSIAEALAVAAWALWAVELFGQRQEVAFSQQT